MSYKIIDIETQEEVLLKNIDSVNITDKTKFICYLDVTDIPPPDVSDYMKRSQTSLVDFFGKGKVLIVPCRGDSRTKIVKVEIDEP